MIFAGGDKGLCRPRLAAANFVALLIASGQSASLAKNALSTGDGLKTVALGTVGVMALRVIFDARAGRADRADY